MKLIALECPKCGAQLEVNAELTQAVCNYCGFQFLIDDEVKQVKMNLENPRQVGYELAWGEAEQKRDECRYNAERIKELIKPVADMNRLIGERNTLYLQIESLQRKEEEGKDWTALISLCIFTVILLLGEASIFAAVIGLAAAVFSFFICRFWKNGQKKIKEAEKAKQLEQKNAQYTALSNRIEQLSQRYDFDYIPIDYRSAEIMKFLYNAIKNQRAVNLQQAINLYEDERHKEEMAELQRNQLIVQKRQLQALEERNVLQKRQLCNVEEQDRQREDTGFSLGKTIKVGGVILTAIALLNRNKD